MTIKLIIGQQIQPNPNPHNTFELVVTSMHGDGDHYTTQSDFGGYDYVVRRLEILEAVFRNSELDPAITCEAVMAASGGDEKFKRDCWNWYYNIVGYDITGEGQLAIPWEIKVFWWDESGNKFDVEVNGMVSVV